MMKPRRATSFSEVLAEITSQALPDPAHAFLTMSTVASTKRVHSLLLCQVCYERFQLPEKAPKVLPCQHSFCARCLQYLTNTATFKCPLCRTQHLSPPDGVNGFPTNLTVVSLMDCYCTLCQSDMSLEQCAHCDKPICSDCKQQHSQQMSESALKKLQQLSQEKDTMQCLCRDVKRYTEDISHFIEKNSDEKSASSGVRHDILQGLCRSLQTELGATSLLVNSSVDLLEAIDAIIENGQELSACEDGCTSCRPEKQATDCDETCDGSCVPALSASPQSGNPGEEWLGSYCNPPAAIKQLNRHIKDVRTFKDALSDRATILSGLTNCCLRRQVNYLVKIGENFGSGDDESIKLAKTQQPLVRPSFITCHRDSGQFYVLDQAQRRVVVLSATGQQTSLFSLDEGRGEHDQHTGLAVTSHGEVLVTDSTQGEVCVYSPSGQLLRHISAHGSKPGQLQRPMDLVCDSDDRVHVCDWGNQRVQVFDSDGKYLRMYGDVITGSPALFRPQFIHLSHETGHVYVSDTQNAQVHVFGDHGNHLIRTIEATECASLEWPAGVTTIRYGYVLIADWSSCCVHVVSSSGQYMCSWGESGTGMGQFDCPKGLAYSEQGSTVGVCDTVNGRLQLIPV